MNNATHYVLDLETMGTGPLSAITAIGCVRVEHGVITAEFYERVDLQSSVASGGQMDASTLQFWLKQSQEARAEVDGSQDSMPLHAALNLLATFMGLGTQPLRTIKLWGNGSSFDNVIIGTAFDRCGIKRPWDFWNDRDLRTLIDIYPEVKHSIEFEGVKHHALDDARYEARILCAALAQRTAQRTAFAGEAA